MESKMRLNSFLIFIIFSSSIIALLQCKGRIKNKDDKDLYQNRVENLLVYINDEGIKLPKDCTDVFLLQTRRCNLCNIDEMKNISQKYIDISISGIYILSAFREGISAFLQQTLAVSPTNIYIDSANKLPKMGLGFMRNLHAKVCNNRILSWEFIDGIK